MRGTEHMNSTEKKRDAIYRDCSPRVRRYVTARVQNPQEAEDLVSEIFLKVYQRLDSFDETKASVSTWVYAVTQNAVIDHYRTRHCCEELPETLAAGETPEEALCRQTTMDALAAALSALDARQRDIIILRYDRGLTLKEIALRMGMSYSYTKALHNGALSTLKKRLT